MATQKTYLYKIYSVSGMSSLPLGVWTDAIRPPRFEVNLNGGLGELQIDLGRKWGDFGENADVKTGNLLKLYVADRETGSDAKLIASGYISGYTPHLAEGSADEFLTVSVLGNAVRLQEAILTVSGGNPQVDFYSMDPTAILTTVMGLYNTTVSGAMSFTIDADSTGSIVTYSFQLYTYKQAIDKILELAPQRWYYTIDPDDTLQFHARKWSADHRLVIGQHISAIEPFKNIEDVKNIIWFVGNGIKITYRNSTSIILYGEKSIVLEDNRISNQASADILANSYLTSHAAPEVRTRVTVIDSNGDTTMRGYDIESLRVGQMVSIIHPDVSYERTRWNEFRWNEARWNGPIQSVLSTPMQIMHLSYSGDQCVLELSTRQPEISKRLEDINRNLKQFIQSQLT